MWLALALGCQRLPPADVDDDPGLSPPVHADDDTDLPADPRFDDDPTHLQFVDYNAEWLADHYEGDDDFVPRNETDYEMIRQLLEDSGFDLMVLQETEGRPAIDLLGLDERWSRKSGESGWSQHVSFVWREDRLRIDDIREVRLPSNEYPQRDPLVGSVTLDSGLRFTLIGLHNKPYVDDESAAFRAQQVVEIHDWLRNGLPTEVDDPALATNILMAGDFNDSFEGIGNIPSLGPLLDDPDLHFATKQATTVSYPGFGGSLIDHVVLSTPLYERWTEKDVEGGCHIIEHDEIEPWCCYTGGYRNRPNISDHRPVWIDLRAD